MTIRDYCIRALGISCTRGCRKKYAKTHCSFFGPSDIRFSFLSPLLISKQKGGGANTSVNFFFGMMFVYSLALLPSFILFLFQLLSFLGFLCARSARSAKQTTCMWLQLASSSAWPQLADWATRVVIPTLLGFGWRFCTLWVWFGWIDHAAGFSRRLGIWLWHLSRQAFHLGLASGFGILF